MYEKTNFYNKEIFFQRENIFLYQHVIGDYLIKS